MTAASRSGPAEPPKAAELKAPADVQPLTISEAFGILDALEWGGTEFDSDDGMTTHGGCPWCSGTEPGSGDPEYEGHADDCRLAAILKAIRKEPTT